MSFGIVGLTGGIGSGKSAVARLFAEQGVPVIDADQVARDVVEPGTEGLAQVVAAFGAGVLDPEGRLDRKRVAARVFDAPEERKKLEAILHPRIAAESMMRMQRLAAAGHPYAIYEATLLVENGSYKMMSALVVVTASPATQLARVCARDDLDEAAVKARIAAQLPIEEKVRVADYVIENDGTMEDLRSRVIEVHAALLARFGASA